MAWNPNIPTVTNRVQDDLDAIRENFQHLDQSRIVEMGSNINGTYVRWENGLQVCFGWVVAFTGDGTSDPKDGTHALPAGFASGAALWAGSESQSWAIYCNHIFVGAELPPVTTSFSWRAERKTGVWVSPFVYRFHFIAIGRWK